MMTNLDRFAKRYEQKLTEAVSAHPERYAYPISKVPDIAQKMVAAIVRGGYDKEGGAIKATCKELGIKHTYKAIRAFFECGEA